MASVLAPPRYPALSLHPNAGITFDLDQIRQDNPDVQIGRFTAVCGIPRELPEPQFSSADVWVLLDGAVCLHLTYPAGRYIVENVDVAISSETRFLTLVATCSGRADYSWIFFGAPFLGPAATVSVEGPGRLRDDDITKDSRLAKGESTQRSGTR